MVDLFSPIRLQKREPRPSSIRTANPINDVILNIQPFMETIQYILKKFPIILIYRLFTLYFLYINLLW